MMFRHFSSLIFFLLISGITAAEADRFFESSESTRYKTDSLPYDIEHDNRFDREPVLTIDKFNISALPDIPEYDIRQEALKNIIDKNLKDNKNRYTIDRLDALVMKLTRYYQQQGMLLARAYVPPQNIRNNTVRIDLIEGTISDIRAPETDVYDTDTLTRPFDQLRGRPGSGKPGILSTQTESLPRRTD